MNYILVGIIAIAIWQTLTFIIYEITRENEQLLTYCSMGIPGIIAISIGKAISKAIFFYQRKTMKVYMMYVNCISRGSFIANPRYVKPFNATAKEGDNFIECLGEIKNKKTPFSRRDIYHGQKTFAGYDMKRFFREDGKE